MTRRNAGHMHGQQYLADIETKEVHDLDAEKPECGIDAVIAAGNDRPHIYLAQAHAEGYDNCEHCLPGSLR